MKTIKILKFWISFIKTFAQTDFTRLTIFTLRTLLKLLIFACCFPAVRGDDSIPTVLGELIVESKNMWIEKDCIVAIPTTKEKKISNSAESLVSIMNTPYLRVRDNEIFDLKGENVKIFINGYEATAVDLQTFWPKDVKRVEYISNSSDSKYKGYPSVVNFVTTIYKTGAVSKINLNQSLPQPKGRYDLASKIEYKAMTYGVQFGCQNYNSRATEQDDEQYRNVYYDNILYHHINHSAEGNSNSSFTILNGLFNAIYKKDKLRLLHSLSFTWKKNSNEFDATDNWNPTLITGDGAWSNLRQKSWGINISGQYSFGVSSKMDLHTTWVYSYANNNGNISNQTGNLSPIYNINFEKAHNLNILSILSHRLNNKMVLQYQLLNETNFYNIKYEGSYLNTSHQVSGSGMIGIRWLWQPLNAISYELNPGLTLTYRTIRDLTNYVNLRPRLYTALKWHQSKNADFGIFGNISTTNTPASASNEAIIRESELKWLMGNPYLKDTWTYNLGLFQTWICTNWFTPSLTFNYLNSNNIYLEYTSAPMNLGGILAKYVTRNPEHNFDLDMDLNFNLLSRKLGIDLEPALMIFKFRKNESGHNSLTRFVINGTIRYILGNFNLRLSYSSSEKVLGNSGTMTFYRPDNWRFGIAYGNGNFYADLTFNDIFHSQSLRQYEYRFDDYTKNQVVWQQGRSIGLNFSYTFGVGRRIDRNINIENIKSTDSGVIGSKL